MSNSLCRIRARVPLKKKFLLLALKLPAQAADILFQMEPYTSATTAGSQLAAALEEALRRAPLPEAAQAEQEGAASASSKALGITPEAAFRFVSYFDELLDAALEHQAGQLEQAMQDALSSAGGHCRAARGALALGGALADELERSGSLLLALDAQLVRSATLTTGEKANWRELVNDWQDSTEELKQALASLKQKGQVFEQSFEQFNQLPKVMSQEIWRLAKRRPRGAQQVLKRLTKRVEGPLALEPVSLWQALGEYADSVNSQLVELSQAASRELAQLGTGQGPQAEMALDCAQGVLAQFAEVCGVTVTLISRIRSGLQPLGAPGALASGRLTDALEWLLKQLGELTGLKLLAPKAGEPADERLQEFSQAQFGANPGSQLIIARLLAPGLVLGETLVVKAKVAVAPASATDSVK